MDDITDVSQFNSFVLKSMSENDNLDLALLSSFPINERSFQLLVDCLFCRDQEMCDKRTKFIAMKKLTTFFESNSQPELVVPIQKYFETSFKYNENDGDLNSSSFSIDLFSTVFKKTPDSAFELLSAFKSELPYTTILKYAIKYIAKTWIAVGFEPILNLIFENPPNLALLYEMIIVQPIGKIILPTFLSENVHFLLFKDYCSKNKIAYQILMFLFQSQHTHFMNPPVFNLFTSQCIQFYDNFIMPIFLQNPIENSELLIELRNTFSFRNIPFDSFFVNLIQRLYEAYQYSIEHLSTIIECVSNLLSFFSRLDQLGCNYKSEEAKQFNEKVMSGCRQLLIDHIPSFEINEYDEFNQLDQSNHQFFEQAAKLCFTDYVNSATQLIQTISPTSFTILREMIMNQWQSHERPYIEIDGHILEVVLQSSLCFFPFFLNYLSTFFVVYPLTSNYFPELYFQSFISLFQLLQETENIDLIILQNAVELIVQIEILDESCLQFLTSSFVFPFFEKNFEQYSDEMIKIYKKLSELTFYDEITAAMIDNPEIRPETKILASSQSSLAFIFNTLIPKIQQFFDEKVNSTTVANFFVSLLTRIKDTQFPFMSPDLIMIIKTICDIICRFLLSNCVDVQLPIFEAVTVIVQTKHSNLSIFLFYEDFFFINLTTALFDLLIQNNVESILDHFNLFLSFYTSIISSVNEISPLILPDSSILFYLNLISSVDLNTFNDFTSIFEVVLRFFKSNRIRVHTLGVTDSLLMNCLKRGSTEKGVLMNLYLSIPYLINLHLDIFSTIPKYNLNDDDMHLLFDGTESEIITITKTLCRNYSILCNV